MYHKKITYKDYNGVTRTGDYYFNINKAELVEIQASVPGGLQTYLEEMTHTTDNRQLVEFIKKLMELSYGVKTPDGTQFIKSKEEWDKFRWSEAYVEMFLSLGNNAQDASDFVNNILPAELLAEAKEQANTPTLTVAE